MKLLRFFSSPVCLEGLCPICLPVIVDISFHSSKASQSLKLAADYFIVLRSENIWDIISMSVHSYVTVLQHGDILYYQKEKSF